MLAGLKVLVILDPDARSLRKLLQRHRVLAIAVVLEADPRQLGALARHYRARPLPLPPELLLQEERG